VGGFCFACGCFLLVGFGGGWRFFVGWVGSFSVCLVGLFFFLWGFFFFFGLVVSVFFFFSFFCFGCFLLLFFLAPTEGTTLNEFAEKAFLSRIFLTFSLLVT